MFSKNTVYQAAAHTVPESEVGSMNMAVPTLAVDFGQLPKVMSPRTLKSLAH
jgi:hypothetical protein